MSPYKNVAASLVQISRAVLFILLVGLAGCASLKLTSKWVDHPINIHATSAELQQSMTQIGDKQALVGLLNDSNYLYLSIVTTEKGIQRQMLMRGFTVWFDPEGGEEQRFGIRFPLGMQPGDFRRMREERTRDRNPEDTLNERIPFDTNEVEILGPKEGAHERLKVIELKQIALAISLENGRLAYQLRVPLTDNGPDPYAIGTSPGSIIGVGLETATFKPPQGMMGERPPGGGMDGGRRRGGGMGEGTPPGAEMQRVEPLNVWANVQLAQGKTN